MKFVSPKLSSSIIFFNISTQNNGEKFHNKASHCEISENEDLYTTVKVFAKIIQDIQEV